MLEAIYSFEVVAPEKYLGDIIGDLSRRRARVVGQERRGDELDLRVVRPYAAAGRAASLVDHHGNGCMGLCDGPYFSLPANDPLIARASAPGAPNSPPEQAW